MKKYIASVATTIFGILLFTTSLAQAQDRPWRDRDQPGDISDLLADLRELTEDGARTRAASPAFLDNLRDLTNRFDSSGGGQARGALLYDDFRDGNFTRNPAWHVMAGSWQVERNGLRTTIYLRQDQRRPRAGAGDDFVNLLLGSLLNQGRVPPQEESWEPERYTSIVTPVRMTNAFRIRMELSSRDSEGQFDFGPYASNQRDAAYRVTYLPQAPNGLMLSRVTGQGMQVLGRSNGPVDLEDGRTHVIEWQRDRSGMMTVTLDGRPMIRASDRGVRVAFDGFMMVNSGGTYWIRSVSIAGPPGAR